MGRVVRAAVLTIISACLLPLACLGQSRGGAANEEYAVKAGMTYNLAKFVRWPEQKQAGAAIICLWGENPFGTSLRDSVAGKSIQGKPVEIRQLERLEEAAPCLIVFISKSESPRLKEILQKLASASVLTVSDMPDFALNGGMIGFVINASRVGLEVNQTAARASGLSVSPNLLKLAKVY